jgi:hypothetical protein
VNDAIFHAQHAAAYGPGVLGGGGSEAATVKTMAGGTGFDLGFLGPSGQRLPSIESSGDRSRNGSFNPNGSFDGGPSPDRGSNGSPGPKGGGGNRMRLQSRDTSDLPSDGSSPAKGGMRRSGSRHAHLGAAPGDRPRANSADSCAGDSLGEKDGLRGGAILNSPFRDSGDLFTSGRRPSTHAL